MNGYHQQSNLRSDSGVSGEESPQHEPCERDRGRGTDQTEVMLCLENTVADRFKVRECERTGKNKETQIVEWRSVMKDQAEVE